MHDMHGLSASRLSVTNAVQYYLNVSLKIAVLENHTVPLDATCKFSYNFFFFSFKISTSECMLPKNNSLENNKMTEVVNLFL